MLINHHLKIYFWRHDEWPFYQHDLQRTGFIAYKGKLGLSNLNKKQTTLETDTDSPYFDNPSIADIDDEVILL